MFAGVRQRIAEVAAVAPRTYWYVWWGTLWASCFVLGALVALALLVTGPARRRRMAMR